MTTRNAVDQAAEAPGFERILDARNVLRSPEFAARLEAFADLPVTALTRAALVCRDEDDFLRRLAPAARR